MSERSYRDPRQTRMEIVGGEDDSQFVLRPVHMPDPRAIDPRRWIYGRHLIRGFVTLLVAPGGTGKSSLILAICIAIATKRQLFGCPIHQQCNTAFLNLEDPDDEIERRLAAIGLRYGITDEELAGRFFMNPSEQKVLIAAESEDGFEVIHPHERKIIERVRDEKIGVLAVDPFAESHQLEENSNPHMVRASAAWRRVARLGDCAVLLAHHVRKGLVESIEAARGAKALTDSARIGLLLSNMTEDEANSLGVAPQDRLSYVRLDDAKANLAPRATKAAWFHLSTMRLENGTPDYPLGDSVAVIEAWEGKSLWEQLSDEDANAILDRISAGFGPENGVRYTDHKAASAHPSGNRWAGQLLIDKCGLSEGQAKEALRVWVKSGLLTKAAYKDPVLRKTKPGLFVNDGKRPGARP